MADVVLDAFPFLAFGSNDVLCEVASQLSLADLARAACVNKAWQSIVDGTPHLWRALCQWTWSDKAYVPLALRTMVDFDFNSDEVASQAEEKERQALMAEHKKLCPD